MYFILLSDGDVSGYVLLDLAYFASAWTIQLVPFCYSFCVVLFCSNSDMYSSGIVCILWFAIPLDMYYFVYSAMYQYMCI